jgi:hypothetical protein
MEPFVSLSASAALGQVRRARSKRFFLCASLLFAIQSVSTLSAQTYIFGRADFPVNGTPVAVATGDFNGDGRVDVVSVNFTTSTVSILLGKSDTTFETQTVYATGPKPFAVAVGDFNKDGNLDLAVTTTNCHLVDIDIVCDVGSVSILLGNGDGTFQAHVDYPVGEIPTSVVSADLNGDGNPDLVIATGGAVSVMLGNGDGTFQSPVSYATATGSWTSVVVGDFNGDHIPDLAVSCNFVVSVLLGKGDGTFGPHTDSTTGGYAFGSWLAVADFNQDGKLDLVNSGSTAGLVSVLLGNGDGTFLLQATFPSGTSVATGDFNGDGKPDIVVTGSYTPSINVDSAVVVMLGNGDGTFQTAVPYGTGPGPFSPIVVDLNGDGKMDIVFAHSCFSNSGGIDGCVNGGGESAIGVLLGLGDGTFVGSNPGPGGPLVSGDFNNDGIVDIAGLSSVALGNGNGTFRYGLPYSAGTLPVSVAAGSFRNNQILDLAIANEICGQLPCNPGTVSVLLGNGDGSFQANVDYGVGLLPLAAAVADLRGNGNLDLIVANNGAATVSILLGNGDGTFQSQVAYATATYPQQIAIGDFNQDGKLDVAVAANGLVSILLGNGDGTFQPHIDTNYPGGSFAIAIGDFNGDGKLDVASALGTSVSILLGNGDGTFQPSVSYSTPGQNVLSIAVGDFNGDGKADLAVGSEYIEAYILLGNGDGTFGPAVGYELGELNSLPSLIVADFNGDRVPDWAGGNGVMLSTAFKAVSPAALNFGSQGTGTISPPQTITLTNPSNVTFSITSIAATGEFAQTNNCPATLAPGANCAITVTFNAAAVGSQSGAISIVDSTRSSPQAIPLTGTGVSGAYLTPYPSRINFAPEALGTTSAPAAVMLVNNGNITLTLSGISVAGGDNADFSQTNNCGSSLTVGASCTVTATFTPTGAGSRVAALSIASTATDNPLTVSLVGTGLGPIAVLSPLSLTFASQNVGTSSAAQVLTLSNTGIGPLSITQIAASGDFSETNTCGASVAAGSSCQISVIFTPIATGNRAGNVTITDDAPGSPQNISLSGTGTSLSSAVASLSPSSLTFASQTVGTSSAAQIVTLTNSGTASMSITQIAVSGDFSETNTCGTSLAAGSSCPISVVFTPTTTGSRTGTVAISDSAPGSPQTATLAGDGSSFGLAIGQGGSSSATVVAGSTATYMLSIGGAGFSGQVTLTCTGAPSEATCSFPGGTTPTVSATSASQFTVSLSTTARSMTFLPPVPIRVPWLWAMVFIGFVLLPAVINSKRPALRFIRAFPLLLLVSACGGGGSTSITSSGTPPGTYSLTVKATAGTASQSIPLSLIVH